MLQFFTKPYPFEARPRESIALIVFIGGFVFLFTLFFILPSPNPSFMSRFIMASCYGGVTIAVATINSFIISAFVSSRIEDQWRVWHEIALYVVNIGGIAVGNYFVGLFLGITHFSFQAILQSIVATLAVAIMPVVVCVLIGQRNKYRKYYALAQSLQTSSLVAVKPADESVHENVRAVLFDEETLFDERDILFLESDKNYVRVKLNSGQEHRVRATLKDVLEKNTHLQNLIRVHRAFIVNKNCIETVDGNAQGLKLQLKNHTDIIPVSRTYINDFKSLAQLN